MLTFKLGECNVILTGQFLFIVGLKKKFSSTRSPYHYNPSKIDAKVIR